MTKEQVFDHIQETTARILREAGKAPTDLTGESAMWGAGGVLDSLDLAVLVIELEGLTGIDPFKDGFVNFRTAEELAGLYAAAV